MATDRDRPTVVSVHAPAPLSGALAWATRMGRRDAAGSGCRWRVMLVGKRSDIESAPVAEGDEAFTTAVSWPDDAPAIVQINAVRDALREDADAVLPNTSPHAFIGAAALALPLLAIADTDDAANRYVFDHWAALADAWGASSHAARPLIEGSMSDRSHPALDAGVIPRATTVDREPTAPPLTRRPDEPIRLLYASRLQNVEKRCMDVAALADALAARGVAFELTVAGEGPAGAELADALAAHAAAGRARLLGRVPSGEMATLHREHDVCLLVSALEGSPVSAIEALGVGRPLAITTGCGDAVVATRNHDAGIIARTADIEAMAEAIAQLREDPGTLRAMSERAHEAARAHFDLERAGLAADDAVIRTIERAGADRTFRSVAEQRWRALLAAATAIGAVETHELETLAIDFLRARSLNSNDFLFTPRYSRDPAEFPLALPDIPNLETTLVLDALERATDLDAERVAIFPAGRHSQRLTSHAADHPALACFVDERAEDTSALPLHILSRPILTPSNARMARIDAVVISSGEDEARMAARAGELFPGIPVLTLYARHHERAVPEHAPAPMFRAASA